MPDSISRQSAGRGWQNTVFRCGAAAVAQFVLGEPGLASAAVIHDGDPCTRGLAHAFAAAFEAEASGGLLNVNFLALPQTAGMYLAGPDTRLGNSVNQSTGRTVGEFSDLYEERFGEPPAAPYWAHAYDATVLLLDAIEAASHVDGGTLVVDRQGIRDYLSSAVGHSGLTGTLSCDGFGDCGAGRISVVHNLGGAHNAETSMSNVVFSYAPPPGSGG